MLLYSVFFVLLTNNLVAAWTDWDKRQTCHPTEGFVQPATVFETVAIVVDAAAHNRQVKVVGAGHSFSQITLTDEAHAGGSIMLNLDKLDRILALPTPADLSVVVEAGIRVYNLNDQLLAAGYALVNTGAIAMQSIAGVTQTGTHGTGRLIGSMASQLLSIDLLLANGTIVTASVDQHADVFGAARVGLGALGIVVRARLSVVPQFKLRRVAMPYPLDQLMLDLPSLYQRYERMQWYYTPFTNNATLLLRLPVPTTTPIVPCWPGDVEKAMRSSANVTCVDWSFKALCHDGDDAVLYTEMEYFVDVANGSAFMHEFQAFQRSVSNQSVCAGTTPKAQPCSLFTGMRYGHRDEVSWMSEMYGRDIAVISLIVMGTTAESGPPEEFALFAKGLEQLGQKYGGRPHWGKMHWATARDLRPVYSNLDRFKAMRRALDPHSMFLNAYLRRVLGEEE